MVVIIDYGMGNLRSVQKAAEFVGAKARISSSPDVVRRASSVILPGVGAFGQAMRNLHRSGLAGPIREHIEREKPFLGICLGFELLFGSSTENGRHKGLGIFNGQVVRFPFKGPRALPVPHMGWNRVSVPRPAHRFERLCNGNYFYFVHSYYVRSRDGSGRFAWARYGIKFAAAVQRGNLIACQFHPEKSGDAGLKVMRYFLGLERSECPVCL